MHEETHVVDEPSHHGEYWTHGDPHYYHRDPLTDLEKELRHYEEELPQKVREIAAKQKDADERYEEFCHNHPYMGEEELSLYHKHYEVEPFFHSHHEKDAW